MICGIGYAYIDTNSVPNVAPLRPIARRIGRSVSAQNKSGTVAASANRPASISPNSNVPTNVEAPREYLLFPCQEGLEDVDKGDGYADGVW